MKGERPMDIMKHMHEVVPFRIGSRVFVKRSNKYAADWPDACVIVGMVWEYQRPGGKVNIWLATGEDIQRGYGSCDGWSVDDLEPVAP